VGKAIHRAIVPDTYVRSDRPWAGLGSQFVLVTIATLFYFAVRMITSGADAIAFSNAESLVDFERTLGINLETAMQRLIIDNQAIVTLWNWVYIWLHWPVILFAMFFLFRYHRPQYVLFRNAMILSGAIGLIIFASYPVAPPRFLDGFTDTVTELSTSYKILQPPSIVNKYAALPSFHVGWNVLAGVVLFRATNIRLLRIAAILSPTLMTFAVVFTANHWIIDAIVGATIALASLGGAHLIRRVTRPVDDNAADDDRDLVGAAA